MKNKKKRQTKLPSQDGLNTEFYDMWKMANGLAESMTNYIYNY